MPDNRGVQQFPATDDQRVENSGNTMRHQYRTLSDAEKELMGAVKDIGQAFHSTCDEIGSSRELSLAKTKIEEAVFWACKHITR